MNAPTDRLGRFTSFFRRVALITLLAAAALMITALLGGLARMGALPLPSLAPIVPIHGPLMISAFFGAVISMERAVALRRPFAFIAPIASVFGGLALIVAPTTPVAGLLFTLAGFSLITVFAHLLSRRFESFTLVMALGAVSFALGNLCWALGFETALVVPWWASFLVLTIAGERLELSRFRAQERPHHFFWLGITLVLLALISSLFIADLAARHLGAAYLLLALYLSKYDIARATIRIKGAPRFMAIALFTGYLWLALAGLLLIIFGAPKTGLIYDGIWHAVFVGFVFSMIFAHAQIILPALAGVRIRHGRRFYLPLIALHLSLILRLIGDLSQLHHIRQAGGIANALAIALFLLTLLSSIKRRRSTR